ncbi:MAG: M20/M25/M40 family metallo-hydrolase, partial [Solirubrobacteraceae bacterium]
LMLCGHTDVVAAEPDGFCPAIRDGRLYGRGTVDMKGGLAAAVVAVERLARSGQPLAGDLLLAGVIDEEWVSAGAERLVEQYRADAAILPEQSDLDVVVEHGGFAWFDLHSQGREAPVIEPEAGIDAIALLAPVLQGIVELDRDLTGRPRPAYGRPSVHPSTIAGGSQFPVYAAACTLGIERCLVAGESVAGARAELEALLERAHGADPRFHAELELIVGREPIKLDQDGPLVRALDAAITAHTGGAGAHIGDMGWADSGILTEAGIPCAIFGPAGDGHHTAQEHVELDSLIACSEILQETARAFCAGAGR